jgi:hypothetical protein
MRFRKLRIAWSVGCGILCLLLIVLWVRSYWWWDGCHGPIPGVCYTTNNSLQGQLSFGFSGFFNSKDWGWGSAEASEQDRRNWLRQVLGYEPAFGFCISKPVIASPSQLIIFVPHWFAVLSAACLAVVVWLPRRFSLRTLLIATTLVATLLGLAVYAARK